MVAASESSFRRFLKGKDPFGNIPANFKSCYYNRANIFMRQVAITVIVKLDRSKERDEEMNIYVTAAF